MNNWMAIVKYDDGRIFLSEQTCHEDAEQKATDLLKTYGSEKVTVYITEIHFAIGA